MPAGGEAYATEAGKAQMELKWTVRSEHSHYAAPRYSHLREVGCGHIVLGDRHSQVQVEHRVPPTAGDPHSLPRSLYTCKQDDSLEQQL